ncbi:MAG: DUF86 domain-containing protein [Nitrospirae bacterium]|nr:DUF86 domain-containing protein [Candidatus Manganitrophaceae bacterium]
MTPIRPEILQRKLGTIIDNLQALRPIEGLSLSEYRKELFRRKATERLLQELIEAAIDINTHLIIQGGNDAPEDYYQSFIKLGELEILQKDLAEQLAPSAGLRNRLVHRYDDLDDARILEAVGLTEALYPRYIQAVEAFLKKG